MVLPMETESYEQDIPFVNWETFVLDYWRWKQGQHVGLIGPTESGKTTLALNILKPRKYSVVFATKPKDPVLDSFAHSYGFRRMPKWDAKLSATKYPHRLLWPDAQGLYAAPKQREAFQYALDSIFRQGGWSIYLDELWVMGKILNLETEIKTFLMQYRSVPGSFMGSSQRPAWIPLEVYDQSTHLFFWRDRDETNLSRISGISGMASGLVRDMVRNLRKHEVLYVRNDGLALRTMSPKTV